MRTTFISTYGLSSNLRSNLPRLQIDMSKAGTEVSTGRHADVGLSLGNHMARTLSFRSDYSQLDAFIASNGLLQNQLQRSQTALSAIADSANSFLRVQTSVSDSSAAREQIFEGAKSALAALTDFVNASGGGQYLFGGVNAGTRPLADYSGAPKTALDAAFAAKFGLTTPGPQDDPAVATITPAAMQDFLDNEFAALFADPAWTTNWSSASDSTLSSRIAPNEKIDTSVSANAPALRKLAMAYTMAAELGTAKLPAETLAIAVSKSRELIGEALAGLSGMQSAIGVAEERVSAATKRMTNERDVVAKDITSLEGVDPIEAKVRFDSLSTQLEMSYAMTTRMLKLSILNYA